MTEENLQFLEGDFEVLDKLGRGGMGQVFKARQKSLDRLVAIKILPLNLCKNEEFIGRFKREARLAGKFYHPNAIQVFDIGENKGQYFYIMEYVDGGSLKEKLNAEGKFDQVYVVEVLRQVLSVLKEAETMKIIHRDIKPDNIMLTSDGIVKLADLGLAREVNDNAGLTQMKIAIGTPHYMAPEQAQGKQVDMRADQYALGITAFQLLTGRPPFSGKNNMEILVQHVKKPMIKPSAMVPTVSPYMDKLILKMTEKDPKMRFQSINEILKALDKVSEAISPTKETKTQSSPKLKTERASIAERRKEKSSYTGMVILLLLVIVIAAGYHFIDFTAYTSPSKAIIESALFRANKLEDEKQFEEALKELKTALEKIPAVEQDPLNLKVDEIESKLAVQAIDKIMVAAFDSVDNCEKGIVKLQGVVSKYGGNAKSAKVSRTKLEERIVQIKAEEQKLLDLGKETAKEEKINKLSQEVSAFISAKKFKQADELVRSFKEKNSDFNMKLVKISENILGLEKEYLTESIDKANEMIKKNEFDPCSLFLNSIKNNFSQKDLTAKVVELLDKIPKLKVIYEKEQAKQNHKIYSASKKSVFDFLKSAEVKAAKIKLEEMKTKGLSPESYELFSKIIESYSYIFGRIEDGLVGEFKGQLKINKIGNRNIEVYILSVKNGVIQYSFLETKLELTLLSDDWASTYTAIANKVTKVSKANRLLQLCHFAYVNGDLEGAYGLAKEAEALGLDKVELEKSTKHLNEDYMDWLDIQFDSVIDKANDLIAEKNKLRAKQIINELIKKHGDTIIYKERKQELDKVLEMAEGK